MKKTTTNDNLTSRVIPGLISEYRIVSLPFWAWFWLDDFMIQNRICYQGILETFGCDGDINNTLRNIAGLHAEHCMRGVHNLANDDTFLGYNSHKAFTKKRKIGKVKNYNFPKVYKLFQFIPCTTTLESVWTRKNFKNSNKVK